MTLAACCALALAPCARAAGAAVVSSPSPASVVDGISDQSLPAWDGAFATSALAGELRPDALGAATARQIAFARYVVQWDALLHRSGSGDYAARFDAWLSDVASVGLLPVVALTSYDGSRPVSAAAYAAGLRALLAGAAAAGHPLGFVEPWNEPNGQGAATAATAAGYANAAAAICTRAGGCQLIAGDFADSAGAASYALAYRRALTFDPTAWGVHPYGAVARHDLASLRALLAALPAGTAAGRRLWITEVAALRCRHGVVLGDGSQARDASFLVDRLLSDPALAPVHTFYYGLQFRDRSGAPCSRTGGDDGELFGADGAPRAAAAIVFPGLASEGRAAAFGPGPASVGATTRAAPPAP
jgi:hypothetical protein